MYSLFSKGIIHLDGAIPVATGHYDVTGFKARFALKNFPYN
jgi:hypothetical protein